MKTIALCMIVKNEAQIIRRCLDRVLPLIDYVLIVDTGSTDGTQSIVREFLQSTNVAGEVIDEPWRDFAYNRTFALKKLRERTAIDYSLMIDADQLVVCDPDFDIAKFKRGLKYDLYDLRISSGNVEYLLPLLANNKIDISYRGVLHEFRVCPEGCSRGVAQELLIQEVKDSARSWNEHKYSDDAAIFERALLVETDPFLIARYKFYLAQSYRDAGESERALKAYLERTDLGFWDEEVFLSFYSAARLKELLKHPEDEVIKTYLDAYRICPRRAEALHGAARFCRITERHEQGYRLAKKGLYLPCPQGGLFVERWIYDFGLLDEFSDLAFSLGHHAECLEACIRILGEGRIPEDQRDRIRQNAHFAVEKLESSSARISETLIDDHETAPVPSSSFSDVATAISRPAITSSRYAIVTPYYKENRATLERCLNSVRRQSVHVDHIVVADGIPQQWIDDEPVRHIQLDTAHGNFGNTPRGLGALMAASEGYEGIGFLDADNWLAEDHVEKCMTAAAKQNGKCDFVIARRFLMAPDGTQLRNTDDRLLFDFVDTNCFFFLQGSYHALHHWVLTPKPLSPICDRIFYAATKNYKLRSALVEEPTVFYECLWSSTYEAAGLPVPPNAKPNIEFAPILSWLDSLESEELELVNKRAGSTIRGTMGEMGSITKMVGRNAPCPCGSGKRYKHCHGATIRQ
jgi:glycosyltransferase involved in cell wall biosynthesis